MLTCLCPFLLLSPPPPRRLRSENSSSPLSTSPPSQFSSTSESKIELRGGGEKYLRSGLAAMVGEEERDGEEKLG